MADFDKANVLNDFFCKQTMLNDENVCLPELPLIKQYCCYL